MSAPAPSRPSSPAPAPQIPAFQAIATTPLTGLGIDRDKVPAMVQTLPAADFSRDYSPNVVETFAQRIPGVTTNNVQGNEFATDLRYRGFAASPLQGTPQGLAVYMQGIRTNEAFGDTVNWDLIPKVAIGRSDVWTNNPAFGLNALGGAISFQMKDGFITAPNSMPQAAPTAASGAPCNTVYVTGNGGSIWQQKALRMTAGATSRHRGWRVSMAISAGRGPMPKFIWSLPQQTISSA